MPCAATYRLVLVFVVGGLLPVSPVRADPVTLTGTPIDHGFEGDDACCVDVAAVNLLEYLDRTIDLLEDDQRSTKQLQDDFHHIYDPESKKSTASTEDAAKGFRTILRQLNATARVKAFVTRELTYAALLEEWNDDELIVLLMNERDQGFGHAVFLWGIETNVATPKVNIIDPNVHPNDRHQFDGHQTNSVGTSTWVDLQIGVDANGLPDWGLRYASPAHDYVVTLPDGTTLIDAYPADAFNYRVVSFVSVSDVKIPEPGAFVLLSVGLAATLVRHRRRGRGRPGWRDS